MSQLAGPLASPHLLLTPPNDGGSHPFPPIQDLRPPGRWSSLPPSIPSGDLSSRDFAILATVARFRIMSGAQLRELFWTEGTPETRARLARRTLAGLAERDLLTALPRRIGGVRAGSAGLTFALGRAGQRVTQTGGRIRPAYAPGEHHLRHTLAVTQMYDELGLAARWGLTELLAFDPEPSCWRSYPGTFGASETLKPDAYVKLGEGEFESTWFIEVDMGTQAEVTVAGKARRYLDCFRSQVVQHAEGVFPRTLWIAPDGSRVTTIESALKRVPEARHLFATATARDAVALLTAGARA